ncbi:MAG: glutamate racemase [Ruminococcus sp.]|nr:glutamate racemase [Ruminococcus sp.]
MVETLSGKLNDGAIGVFDSGVGGLTCVKELIRLMPHEDIVYLGDTARVPYGTRSQETIADYAKQDIAFMEKHNVKLLLVACGTVSAVMQSVPIFEGSSICCYSGVIIPAVDAAIAATKNGKIGVIATPASIRSGCYEEEIHRLKPDVEVFSRAGALLVPLAEGGYTTPGCEPAEFFVREYLSEIKAKGVDTLIMGCTHYPLFEEIVGKFMGENVALISPGAVTARLAYDALKAQNALNCDTHKANIELYCTDSVELFKENVERFLGGEIDAKISQCKL